MNRAQHEEAERPKVETWASRRWGSFGQLPVSVIGKVPCAQIMDDYAVYQELGLSLD
jgi:hypothetical protein